MVFERFRQFIRALREQDVEYVLVGGVAVNLHGIVRATEDVDLFVDPAPENVERLKAALRSLWDDPEIDSIRVEDLAEYSTLRYGPPGEDFVVDFLTRLGTRFGIEDLEAETLVVDGEAVIVATPRTLVRMKRGTVRPVDQRDADALAERFDLEDEECR